MERLALHIESLIFSAENTIGLNQIKTCIEETLEQSYKNVEIKKAIDILIEKYRSDDFSFEIVEIASGYKFLTKGSFHNTVGTLIKKNNQKRLSKAALETLSIIAYKQNVTKSDVEGIRGVNCDYTIQKLLEKDLVTIKGRAEGPGRPLLYGTSDKFMDYFGIKDIDSLPKLQDLKVPEIQIGEPAPIEEDRAVPTNEANLETETANDPNSEDPDNTITEANIEDQESDAGNQVEPITEANIEDQESEDGNQAESITAANIEDQESDAGNQAEAIVEMNIEDQESKDGNQADSITAANIEDQESDVGNQAEPIAETNIEDQISEDGDQADSITEANIEDQKSDVGNQAEPIAEMNIENQESDAGNQADSITEANIVDQESDAGIKADLIIEANNEDENNQTEVSEIDTASSSEDKSEEMADVINGEKPMEDEEAHQALLNQEIISSVYIEETSEQALGSVKTSIISDEEE